MSGERNKPEQDNDGGGQAPKAPPAEPAANPPPPASDPSDVSFRWYVPSHRERKD